MTVVNATYVPTNVTISEYILGPIIVLAVVGSILSLAFLTYIIRKDPTIGWRARHLNWAWDFWVSPSNDIRMLPIMETNIDEDNSFSYGTDKEQMGSYLLGERLDIDSSGKRGNPTDMKGDFQLKSKNEKGQVTRFSHKGHPAYIHTWNNSAPHGFTSNSLEPDAAITPQQIYKCKDGSVRKQIDSIRVGDPVSKTSIGLIILALVIIILSVIGYTEMASIMSFLQSHFGSQTPSNSTTTQSCPSGYIVNTKGVCVPQAFPYSFVAGLLFPNISMSWRKYRQYLGFSRLTAKIAAATMILFVPSTTIAFAVSHVQSTNTWSIADPYNYDMVIVMLTMIFWFFMWKIGSVLGDFIFKLRNPWFNQFDSLSDAREAFKLIRRQATSKFWDNVESFARIENWLEAFKSDRPTLVSVGGL